MWSTRGIYVATVNLNDIKMRLEIHETVFIYAYRFIFPFAWQSLDYFYRSVAVLKWYVIRANHFEILQSNRNNDILKVLILKLRYLIF